MDEKDNDGFCVTFGGPIRSKIPLVMQRQIEIKKLYDVDVRGCYWFDSNAQRIDYLEKIIKGEII